MKKTFRSVEKTSNKALGYTGESTVVDYLRRNNYQIIDTNWTISGGELDIIAGRDDRIIFVEVKLRSSKKNGTARESLTPTKAKRFRKCGLIWAMQYGLSECSYQYDFISLQKNAESWRLEHYKNIELPQI